MSLTLLIVFWPLMAYLCGMVAGAAIERYFANLARDGIGEADEYKVGGTD